MKTNQDSNFITINYHITEKCNYSCTYCYAHWNENTQELFHNLDSLRAMFISVYEHFKGLGYESVRLNIAGGEPLLCKTLPKVLTIAASIGYDISLITNGSLISDTFISESVQHLSTIGFSIDSLYSKRNNRLGRCTKNGYTLTAQRILKNVAAIRKQNHAISIKINTVVSNENYDEVLKDFIEKVNADKWKIFQAMPFEQVEYCSKKSFDSFIKCNQSKTISIYLEDNIDMSDSYLMIDPYGRFFQNSDMLNHKNYHYSQPIHIVGTDKALSKIKFNIEKFRQRYIRKSKL